MVNVHQLPDYTPGIILSRFHPRDYTPRDYIKPVLCPRNETIAHRVRIVRRSPSCRPHGVGMCMQLKLTNSNLHKSVKLHWSIISPLLPRGDSL